MFSEQNLGNDTRAVKLIRTIRLIRLFKLARLLKMNRIFKQIEAIIDLTPMVLRLCKLGGYLFVLAHLIACFWFYASLQADQQLNECDSGRLSCQPDDPATTWWKVIGIDPDDQVTLYIASLYWTFTTVITVGYGDITPMNLEERIYTIVAMMLGSTMFGYIIGSIASLAGAVRGFEAHLKNKLTEIRDFCNGHKIPSADAGNARQWIKD